MRARGIGPWFAGCLLVCVVACSERAPAKGEKSEASSAPGDTIVLDRVRFLDEMGFDRPVEAFSVLFPRGWKTEGGVKWGSVSACRGEMIAPFVKGTAKDGSMQVEGFALRSFQWTDDAQLRQVFEAGARSGGCEVKRSFDARAFANERARALQAEIVSIVDDEERNAQLRAIDAQANEMSRSYGNDVVQASGLVYADLTFADGRGGILHVGVTDSRMRKPNMLTGGVTLLTSTMVIQHVLITFVEKDRDKARRLLETMMRSHRTNPTWQAAKDKFLMDLSSVEHQGRMERIRLMGEQSRAYAKAANEAHDTRMRAWEKKQVDDDAAHKRFVRTIREVEAWKDDDGVVELGAGYERAFSRGDGSYVLTNDPNFDPKRALDDHAWEEMRRAPKGQ